MANYIEVGPSGLQVFAAIKRVLIVRGDMQIDENYPAASCIRRRAIVLPNGSAMIEALESGECRGFLLDSPTRGLLVEEGWSVEVTKRTKDCVILVFEELSEQDLKA
jgi:hypothetical protein